VRIVISSLLLIFSVYGCSNTPAERAKEFMTNVYTGKTMQADDWLTRDARSSRLFNTFGGIDALVNDSFTEAARNQGLKSVRIISTSKQQDIYTIETEVVFNNKVVASSKENWIVEDGKWKISFTAANH
jgi:hypothetical protein